MEVTPAWRLQNHSSLRDLVKNSSSRPAQITPASRGRPARCAFPEDLQRNAAQRGWGGRIKRCPESGDFTGSRREVPVRGVSAPNWISKGRVGAQQPVLTARTAWRLSQSRPNEKCRSVPLSWVILRVKRQDPKSRRPGAPDLESVQPRSAALCPLPEVLPSSAIGGF